MPCKTRLGHGESLWPCACKLRVQRVVVWGLFLILPHGPGCFIQAARCPEKLSKQLKPVFLFFFFDISWDKNYLGVNRGYVDVAVTLFVRQGQVGDRDTVTFSQPQHNELMLRRGATLILLQHLPLRRKLLLSLHSVYAAPRTHCHQDAGFDPFDALQHFEGGGK